MIIERFEEIVQRHEHKIAVKAGDNALTYGELKRFANRIARAVVSVDKNAGQAAGLVFAKGVNQVAALLGVLTAGKMYVPLDITYPAKRLEFMINDSGARLILTDQEHLEAVKKLAQGLGENLVILDIDSIADDNPGENVTVTAAPDQAAYILYTSGSTGKPKGVLQVCENVVFYSDVYINALSITARDRMTFISSFSHDGAVQDIYGALLSGAALYPMDLRKTPAAEIARLMMKENITVYHSVPTLFRYFAASLGGGERFPSLRLIVTGGEPLRQTDVSIAREGFPGARLAHMYGQTESSVNTMGFIDVSTGGESAAVTIGAALDGVELLLLKENGEEVMGHETGEIFVVCEHIARGYWKNPEASASAFFKDEEMGRVYRTGDLGRYHYSGQIEFVGRKDSQVKIRGYRVELQEIENCLRNYEGIDEAVVVARDAGEIGGQPGEKTLCAYFTVCLRRPFGESLFEKSSAKTFPGPSGNDLGLPDYMVPSFFVQLDEMPRTPGGKIDRGALPLPVVGDGAVSAEPRDALEQRLVEIWALVLGLETGAVGIDGNFFELGGHSLKATILASKIHRDLNVNIPLVEIFNTPTVRGLARYIKDTADNGDTYERIEPVEEKEFYRLSYNQERLWIIHQLESQRSAYHLSAMMALRAEKPTAAVQQTLDTLIRRHESLRTCFILLDNEPVQVVRQPGQVATPLDVVDVSTLGKEEKEKEITRVYRETVATPFNLGQAPLFRAVVLRVNPREFHFVFNMHHIISDGWSMELLKREFLLLYEACASGKTIELTPLRIQYKDFAAWQHRRLQDPAPGQEARRYWQENILTNLPDFHLLQDVNPAHEPGAGASLRFVVDVDGKKQLNRLAVEQGTSLFAVIFSVSNMLLSSLSGQQEVVCGITAAGREHSDLEPVVGFLVNTLIMRFRPDYEENFAVFLNRVGKHSLEAMRHQWYPLELVLDDLKMKFPDLSVMFNMLNAREAGELEVKGGSEVVHGDEARDVKRDLSFYVMEYRNGLEVRCTYRKRVFEPERMEHMMNQYLQLLNAVSDNPDKKIKEYFTTRKSRRMKL